MFQAAFSSLRLMSEPPNMMRRGTKESLEKAQGGGCRSRQDFHGRLPQSPDIPG